MKCSRSQLTCVCGLPGSVAKRSGYSWQHLAFNCLLHTRVEVLTGNSRVSVATLRGTVTNRSRGNGYTSQAARP
jgi:hypothetical protein